MLVLHKLNETFCCHKEVKEGKESFAGFSGHYLAQIDSIYSAQGTLHSIPSTGSYRGALRGLPQLRSKLCGATNATWSR
jgi:hypothetical protein